MSILSTSVEDYLKAIYDLSRESGSAATTAVAARLDVAPASVTLWCAGSPTRMEVGTADCVSPRRGGP
jgi:hypothetical protein